MLEQQKFTVNNVCSKFYPIKKDRTENIQKTYKKCAPYGNCTEIVQKIYKKCTKFCNSSLVETGSLFELLQILAHFLYIFCTISVQFPYGAHFLYVFCMFSYVFYMFSVRSFFIGLFSPINSVPTTLLCNDIFQLRIWVSLA